MASILKVRDADGTVHEIHALQGKSAYQYAVEGGYTGTEEEFAAKLAEEIPDALPNPNALTFTGAVTGSYDGSAPLEVEIPSGGGAAGDYIPIPASAEVGQTIVVTAVDDTGKPTTWEAVDMPISFKPAGKSYMTFSSPNSFTLAVNDATKHWDGTLEYFASDKTWTVWDGTTTLSAIADDGEYVLYLRGTGNTIITGSSENYRWVLTGTDIKCIGNIENLLDYATVASGEHPTMANSCYEYMFYGCTSLTQAPELPAITLADYCYYSMFCDCTSLTQASALPATTLANNCYYYMFRGCTALTQVPELPATTLADYCYRGMFYNCTSLTKAPALPATTLANSCYMAMFYGCTSLAQIPALPATTLTSRCYYGMFHGCTNLKLSSTRTGEYTQEYCIPSSGEGVATTDALANMFTSTGGTFTGTPAINTTYYLSSDNMIVRETEIDTLNGYVGSMIDVAIAEHTSNPLNITGATVGQIAKITAVDENGKPTAWAPVDMPSGGGGETWEAINTITLSDAVNTVTINQDSGGNAIALKKVRILVEGSATHNQDMYLNNSRYIREQVVGTGASVGALSAEPFCGKMYCFAVKNNNSNYAANNQTANIFSGEITITEIKLIVTNDGTFSAGTKFKIQGVRT